MNPPQILIAVTDATVYFKPVGRANIKISADFKSAMTELRNRGYRQLVLDLAECEAMDSTFLGVLSACALQLGMSADPAHEATAIQLRHPNGRILSSLEDLGVRNLFHISETEPKGLEYQAAPTGTVSREVLSQTSLEAHQTLMAIDPANIPKFKDVVAFLKEDLARLQSR
jgi:anti-sigma B factor antagonist